MSHSSPPHPDTTGLWDMHNLTNGTGSNGSDDASVHNTSTLDLPRVIGCSIGLIIVIIMTILGNLLVVVTICTTRRLQNPTNYFILSLSITDFLLGIFVLPFSAWNTVALNWPLGGIFCNIYTSMDVMLCTVSILTLFAISLDRYISVTKPLKYDEKMTWKIVLWVMIGVWVFSFVMAFLPIHLGWNTPSGAVQNMKGEKSCIFELNRPYVLLVSLPTYFAPLIIMCGVYLKILNITKHQVRQINKLTMPSSNGRHMNSEQQTRQVSDRKATVTLATIVLAFAVCWVPYFMLFTLKPFGIAVNEHIDLLFLWLGYANSMINPFLYGFYNSVYRDSFKKILCRGCTDPQKKYNALLHKRNSMSTTNTNHRNGSAISESSELANMKKNSTVITFMSEHANS